jgi:hypothetical protein
MRTRIESDVEHNVDFRIDFVSVNGRSTSYHYDQNGILTQAAGLNLVCIDLGIKK